MLSVKTLKGQIDRLGHLATSLLSFGKPSEARSSALSLDQRLVAVGDTFGVDPLWWTPYGLTATVLRITSCVAA